jgi:uncharacterized protein YdaU (DUF1376 family)
MHYYQHNIGDFDKATRHLTRVERSIYRDLIELYYNDEMPLINDTAALCRKIIARTEEELTAVEQVLNEFFYLDDDCWNNTRCNKEINAYHTNQKSKSKAGLASAEARKRKSEARKQQQKQQDRTDVQHVSNTTATEGQQNIKHKPITNNHKPLLSASGDAANARPTYKTKKGKSLTGEQLYCFNEFWEAFNYRKGKAEAADTWIDLKINKKVFSEIINGAKIAAAERAGLLAAGKTPKMAQGWLSSRRWEDEDCQIQQTGIKLEGNIA